jgi:SET domain-containing protein
MLEVRQSKYGRGVFATRDIQSGELIHVAPVIVLSKEECETAESTILANYVFSWRKKTGRCALALGYGSLFNHSYTPNAKYKLRTKKDTIEFFAYTDIKAGDEIFVNYNGKPEDQSPLWFEVF